MILTSVYSFAENSSFRLGQLGIEEGLPNSSVSSILQDHSGFIWFGTQGGLAKYDGYGFEVFTQDPFDRNSLSHNLIQTMSLDRDGSLWIGTYAGLNHFDPLSGRFSRYDGAGTGTRLSNNIVTAVYRDSRGRLWIGTLDGLNRLMPDRSFRNYFHDETSAETIGHSTVRDIHEDSDGRIWFATYGGLSAYSEDTDSFENFLDTALMAIEEDPANGMLRLASWDGRIFNFNPATADYDTKVLKGHNLYQLKYDSAGRLWAAGWGSGLSILSADGTVSTYTTETADDLSHDVIYSLFEDRSGVMWIGTNGGGLNKYVESHNRFNYYEPDQSDPDSIPADKVLALAEDASGGIWAGIKNRGVFRVEKDGGIRKYTADGRENSLSNNIVNDILPDSRGRLWIMTDSGFNRYRPETDDFEQYYHPERPDEPEANIFTRIFEDAEGRLWAGTYNSGLIIFTGDLSEYSLYSHSPYSPHSISSNLIRSIMQDSKGRIWVATNNGLNLYNSDSGLFRRFTHEEKGTLSNNDVRALYEDGQGGIWAATRGGGISILDPDGSEFSYISNRDGLLSNMVYDIKGFGENEIWIAEQNCISIYSTLTGGIRNITSSSGLLGGELSSNLLLTSSGEIWSGGTDGITIIPLYYDRIRPYNPEVRITSLEVNGRPYFGSAHTIDTGSIILSHSRNNLSIELNCDDYTFPKNNRFSYKLEGFEPEWMTADKRNYINYTNLPPGHYTFRAEGRGSMNNPSENEVRLDIKIKPHPAASAPAVLAYVITASLSIWWMILRIRRKRRLQEQRDAEREQINRELEARVRQRTAEIAEAKDAAEEATRAKSLFLANMSHEIRTPLNGIIGMLELLKKSAATAEQKQYIGNSQVSADSLLTLLDDILNYEKSQSGKLKLNITDFSFSKTIEYIDSLYSKQIRDKGIDFIIENSQDIPDRLCGDEKKLIRIISNLVSNAMKYTDSGTIRLKTGCKTDAGDCTVLITISDTGCGIPSNKLDSIFNSFEQLDSSYTKTRRGVGLGLAIVTDLVSLMGGAIEVESVLFNGSEFRVRIPFKVSESGIEDTEISHDENAGLPPSLRILIAEDEAINRLYLSKLLNEHGFEYLICENGREAVTGCETFKPDLVFMDIGMPEMNGIEAVLRIREQEKQSDSRTAIIMLSAHVYGDDIEQSMNSGADDFLPKPFSENDFVSIISKWSKKLIDGKSPMR